MGNIPQKLVSDSFYQHEIEEELREKGLSWSFNGDDSDGLTAVLKKINTFRSRSVNFNVSGLMTLKRDEKYALHPIPTKFGQ